MPCIFTECEPTVEAQRFVVSLVGIYVYHFVWDLAVLTPFVRALVRRGYVGQEKTDKMRESLWKNVAVGTLFTFGLYNVYGEDWFFQPELYFVDFPWSPPEGLRWYYMMYLSFWIQSIDFMLGLTNHHYKVKRKDNMEMLTHHFATITLMVFSYSFDLTRVGACVLLLHDVNDLLLETAKFFVYLEIDSLANLFFGLFAVVWFIIRWYYFASNIIYSCYSYAYDQILVPIYKQGEFFGKDPDFWYWCYVVLVFFLCILLALHIFWGLLIARMVVSTLTSGHVEKDIRSDSEDEAEDVPPATTKDASKENGSAKARRRRAPRAE